MENHFANFETSKMLKEIGFDEPCFAWFNYDGEFVMRQVFTETHGKYYGIEKQDCLEEHTLAPLWQQAEEWLWNNKKISIEIERVSIHTALYKVRVYQYIDNEPGLIQYLHFESPITCKIEAIKTAVKHLSDTAVAVTPNNTKPNSH